MTTSDAAGTHIYAYSSTRDALSIPLASTGRRLGDQSILGVDLGVLEAALDSALVSRPVWVASCEAVPE